MIELPEALNLSEQLAQTFAGKTIVSAVANASPHGFAWYTGDPALYGQMLSGKTVTGAAAFGGQVELQLGDEALVFNDGIRFNYLRESDKRPDKHQLLLEFDDGCAVCCTVQMYGGMCIYHNDHEGNIYYTAPRELPSPLSDAFDAAYFGKLWAEAKQNLSIKALLATEQRIPGLGNGVLQDILFNARINPRTKLSTLNDTDRQRVFDSVKSTLTAMRDGGGRDTEKDLYGNAGGYRSTLSSKTVRQPCPVCLGSIVREAYLGGNVYFCPTCQPIKK